MFSTAPFTVLVFLVFQFSRNCRVSRTKIGGLATYEQPQDSGNGPVDPFIEPCVVTDCQKCTNSHGCYLNVNYSAPVFTANSVNYEHTARSFK